LEKASFVDWVVWEKSPPPSHVSFLPADVSFFSIGLGPIEALAMKWK
jgi:hypothetical protein